MHETNCLKKIVKRQDPNIKCITSKKTYCPHVSSYYYYFILFDIDYSDQQIYAAPQSNPNWLTPPLISFYPIFAPIVSPWFSHHQLYTRDYLLQPIILPPANLETQAARVTRRACKTPPSSRNQEPFPIIFHSTPFPWSLYESDSSINAKYPTVNPLHSLLNHLPVCSTNHVW